MLYFEGMQVTNGQQYVTDYQKEGRACPFSSFVFLL